MGFLEQLLSNLTIRVPPQPAQEREPSRRRPWHQGPGDADCRWNLFSMYCRPVGQVIFANWLANEWIGDLPLIAEVIEEISTGKCLPVQRGGDCCFCLSHGAADATSDRGL